MEIKIPSNKKMMMILLSSLSVSSVFGQYKGENHLLFGDFNEKWEEYCQRSSLPENPNAETKQLFENMKHIVEEIHSRAFKPYYTTDSRIMTSIYYRVTVNKCGWQIEDYF
jgi:hypothetical protein